MKNPLKREPSIDTTERQDMIERLILKFMNAGSSEERKVLWDQIQLLRRGQRKVA